MFALFLNPDVLLFFRSLGMLAVLPLGWELLPIFIRISGAALITFCCGEALTLPPVDGVAGLGSNFVAGLLVGLPVAVAFSAAQMCGEILDAARGQSIGSVLDPFFESTSTGAKVSTGAFLAWCGGCGGFVEMLNALRASVRDFPDLLGKISIQNIGETILVFWGPALAEALWFAFPFLIVCICCEVLLGLLGKLLPGARLSQEAFILKSTLCFLVLAWISQELAQSQWFAGFDRITKLFRYTA